MLGGAGLVCVAFACAFVLRINLAGTGADQALDVQPPPAAASADARQTIASRGYAKLALALNRYATFFDNRYSLGFRPGTFARTVAFQVEGDPSEAASRPSAAETSDVSSTASLGERAVQIAGSAARRLRLPQIRNALFHDGAQADRTVSNAPADKPSIFERLFGRPAKLTLAYAAPDDGSLVGAGRSIIPGRYDRDTAVYDISAHTVYLPDGTKLEAHSGLGNRLDDPRHVEERNRGPTPPTVYDLRLRESPFHGVQALRLIPVDNEKVFGRTGLLAHTYMLGPNGDSNGCVSFRNYRAFLQAYTTHLIRRLVVVSRLD